MESYKMNDGMRFYDYPGQREELRNKHKTKLSHDKLRRKRKSKQRK